MTVSVRLAGAGLHEREDGLVRLERRSSRSQHARAEFGGAPLRPLRSPPLIGTFP